MVLSDQRFVRAAAACYVLTFYEEVFGTGLLGLATAQYLRLFHWIRTGERDKHNLWICSQDTLHSNPCLTLTHSGRRGGCQHV